MGNITRGVVVAICVGRIGRRTYRILAEAWTSSTAVVTLKMSAYWTLSIRVCNVVRNVALAASPNVGHLVRSKGNGSREGLSKVGE